MQKWRVEKRRFSTESWHICNLHINNNLHKLKAKYPNEKKSKWNLCNIKDYKIDFEKTKKKLQRMNPKSAAGVLGITNKLLLYAITNDDKFQIVQKLIKILEQL